MEADEIDEKFFQFVLKAKESGRKFIFLMEDDKKKGAHTAMHGSLYSLSRMLTSACRNNEEFKQAFKVAMLEMSVADIDELLKNNNPFKKTEPAPALSK